MKNTPHFQGFARLASGALYEAVGNGVIASHTLCGVAIFILSLPGSQTGVCR